MNKAATLQKIEELEFHGSSCLQIAASLRKDLGMEEAVSASSARKGLSVEIKTKLRTTRRRAFKKQ